MCRLLRVLLCLVTCPAMAVGCAPDEMSPDVITHGGGQGLVLAQLAPRFIAHQQDPGAVTALLSGVPAEPVDLSHMTGAQLKIMPPMNRHLGGEDSKYDLRKLGLLTRIKSQNGNQSCWTFPPMAALESNLLPGERWDLSENNLCCRHGFDLTPEEGGTPLMAMAYLARTGGPVSDQDDPYPTQMNAPCTSPPGLPNRKVVTEMLIIPDRTGPLDNANIKAAIKAYGPLATCMDYDSSHYLPMWKSYRNPNPVTCTHRINLVGWDDNFDGFGFVKSAPGHGAFIFRNSWGKKWAEGGYAYASYYDPMIGTLNRAYTVTTNPIIGGRVYQHDPLGWVNSVGYQQPTAWMANVFAAKADEPLYAVSFYAASPGSTYEVRIYDEVSTSPTGKTLLGSRTGTFAVAGYHSVQFDSLGIKLKADRQFSVVVKLSTPGFDKPIAVEYPLSRYSSKATAKAGQSFVSPDGVIWTDLTSVISNANVCLKAFTGTRDEPLNC